MSRRASHVLVRRAAVLVATLLFLLPVPVAGATGTRLSLAVPEVVALGEHPLIRVRLQTGDSPVEGATVDVLLDGRATLRLLTGPDGRAEARLERDLPAGAYEIQARFRGTISLPATRSATRSLAVEAASLVIATVPPVANRRLVSIDGEPLTTDADGLVRFPVREIGALSVTVTPTIREPDREIRFLRWGDVGEWGTRRTVRVPGVTRLEIGFEIREAIQPDFRDPTGARVDPSRIDLLQVRDARGKTWAIDPGGTTWLPSNRISRHPLGLRSTNSVYRLEQATVRGQPVVNCGQQRFRAASSRPWEVEVLMYTLRIRTEDALLGSPVGASVRLVHPDGAAETIALDDAGAATIRQLPRGDYELSIVDEAGMALKTPVALSRDQEARVLLVSVLDIVVMLVVVVLTAAGVVLFGRRAALRLALRRASTRPDPVRPQR